MRRLLCLLALASARSACSASRHPSRSCGCSRPTRRSSPAMPGWKSIWGPWCRWKSSFASTHRTSKACCSGCNSCASCEDEHQTNRPKSAAACRRRHLRPRCRSTGSSLRGFMVNRTPATQARPRLIEAGYLVPARRRRAVADQRPRHRRRGPRLRAVSTAAAGAGRADPASAKADGADGMTADLHRRGPDHLQGPPVAARWLDWASAPMCCWWSSPWSSCCGTGATAC